MSKVKLVRLMYGDSPEDNDLTIGNVYNVEGKAIGGKVYIIDDVGEKNYLCEGEYEYV